MLRLAIRPGPAQDAPQRRQIELQDDNAAHGQKDNGRDLQPATPRAQIAGHEKDGGRKGKQAPLAQLHQQQVARLGHQRVPVGATCQERQQPASRKRSSGSTVRDVGSRSPSPADRKLARRLP